MTPEARKRAKDHTSECSAPAYCIHCGGRGRHNCDQPTNFHTEALCFHCAGTGRAAPLPMEPHGYAYAECRYCEWGLRMRVGVAEDEPEALEFVQLRQAWHVAIEHGVEIGRAGAIASAPPDVETT